mmetsp:Transcript_5925/g.15225  ORF Transcript_5925/g.15225 Transcript_5925/m.15225 type:complete len:206 (+) Transcript_5925:435-1052(+)
MTMMPQTPCEAHSCFTALTMSSADAASRPEVGSSRQSTDGSATSSMPMLTRLRCPPLMPRRRTSPTMAPRSGCRLRSSSDSSTRRSFCARVTLAGSRNAAWYQRLSSTVRSPYSTSSCGTKPTLRRQHAGVAGTPLMRTVPQSRPLDRPAMASSRDVLPHPLEPMMACSCELEKLPLMSSRITSPPASLSCSPSTTTSAMCRPRP